MPALAVRDLSYAFQARAAVVHAISGVSLDVADREFVSIVGPSGCGKSTFLHIIGGFLHAASGTIRLDGRDVGPPGPDRGMLFQDLALFPWKTVEGNIAWGLEERGDDRATRDRIIQHQLKMVGLSAFRKSYPHELSGGMKQRVALARTLAYDPAVLLMDEPFGALDAQTRELMQEQLMEIWAQSPRTVLFVTHDIDEAVYLSNRVVVFTARPAAIKKQIEIDLPLPRVPELKKSERFFHLRNEIWDLLREESIKAYV
jgi:NitT/TauT family transport system ATP-binding protein